MIHLLQVWEETDVPVVEESSFNYFETRGEVASLQDTSLWTPVLISTEGALKRPMTYDN